MNSLQECWQSEQLRRLFDEAAERRRGVPACQDCPYWLVCGGGSPARAYAAHGTMLMPDDLCEAKQVFLDSWFQANQVVDLASTRNVPAQQGG
jgi:sulfatase maturation enzyme AslB (radical SAM superfamily)